MTTNDDRFDDDGEVHGPDDGWNAVLPGAAPPNHATEDTSAAPAAPWRLPGTRLQQIAGLLALAGLLVLAAARLLPATQQTAVSIEVSAEPPLLPADEPASAEPTVVRGPEEIIVYVSGAVVAPDVYRLPADARVIDAVAAAGGPADDADLERINLAAPLSDAAQISVPRLGSAAAPEAAAAVATSGSGGLININRADAAELDRLPGVGPALAQRIIEYRTEHGPFADAEALNAVSGVGERLLAQLGPLISFAP